MREMLLLGIWLFSVRCEQPKMCVSAQEGGLVDILCRYDIGYETYPKYLYKGDYGKREIIINTTKFKTTTQKGKYNLRDDTKERILHVTIHNLNLNDGGTYWCEIDANTFDPKTEIKLSVYKAPVPLKPPLVTSKPSTSTTVQTISRNQQQSARTTVTVKRASSTALWSTSPEAMDTVSLPWAGKELLVVAAAPLLLSLLVVLYVRLRKHRHDTARAFGPAVSSLSDTRSTLNNTHMENHSPGQQRQLDPPVDTSSSDTMYTAVTCHRGPDVHASIRPPVTIQTRMANPVSNSSVSSCLLDDSSAPIIDKDEENICSVSNPFTEAGDQHILGGVHMLYSTVCFNTEAAAQPRRQIGSAAGPSEVYATIRHPKT